MANDEYNRFDWNSLPKIVAIVPPVLDASVDTLSVTVSVPLTTENGFRLTGFLNSTFSKTIELPKESAAVAQ